MEPNEIALRRLRWVTHGLLLVALVAGLIAVRFDLRLGLIPAAVVFGWTQIAGV